MKNFFPIEQDFKNCLKAFLHLSKKEAEAFISLRAFTLHSLERLTPDLFKKCALDAELKEALQDLTLKIPLQFTPELSSEKCLARIDAVWIFFQRNMPLKQIDIVPIKKCIKQLYTNEEPMAAWLLEQMLNMVHLKINDSLITEPSKEMPLLIRLYWLTHVVFIATDFMQNELKDESYNWAKKELIDAIPIVLKQEWVDIGGEILLCLLCFKEHDLHHQQLLLNLIRKHQLTSGVVIDPALSHCSNLMPAHTTAVALLAYALSLNSTYSSEITANVGVNFSCV